MKNSTNDGIMCDYCGDEVKGDFVYYSFDFRGMRINGNFIIKDDGLALSADICEKCMELFRQRVIQVSEHVSESSTRCDISGDDVRNEAKFYACAISKASVDISHQPYKCGSCGKERMLESGPCSCGNGMKLVRGAAVTVDGEYLKLNFSKTMFDRFKAHTDHIKGIGDAEWTK